MEQQSTILIADDDPFIRTIIEKTLTREGYSVIIAEDGRQAFELASAEQPDLLLVDLGMPEMTGMEVLIALRHKKSDIPIIVLTAQDDINTVIEALQKGANDFMSKPFEQEELLARVKTHLEAKAATRMKTLLAFAGAACHEMNQPLQVILGRTAMMKENLPKNRTPPNIESEAHINAIEKAGNKLLQLTRRIRDIEKHKIIPYVGNANIVDLGEESN
jgi:DNA-binding response OmpR family regulator